jgi:hypothetical protein
MSETRHLAVSPKIRTTTDEYSFNGKAQLEKSQIDA